MNKILFALVFLIACNSKREIVTVPVPTADSCAYLLHQDSLQIAALNDQLTDMSHELNRIPIPNSRLKTENDSLRDKLFVANYKVERVRYYLNITLRNPSQDKFLKGWIKRAIE